MQEDSEPKLRNVVLDALLLGVVGAASARVFVTLLELCTRFFGSGGALSVLLGPHRLWLVPLATTLGGLLAGTIVYSLAPEAEGHGTDAAVSAFHRSAGFIRARVPFVKTVASAITIGSGGSAGREGPVALVSAGVASIYSDLRHRTPEQRRLLGLAGMAAGLAAIFRSPVGTALFAVEVLYASVEFEGGPLLPALLASVTAYAVNGAIVGFEPLFHVPSTIPAPQPSSYFGYAALGLVAGAAATLLPNAFYLVRDFFRAIPIPPHFKPALGGALLGLIALPLPQILGGGYSWIQQAIDGSLAGGLLWTLFFAKVLGLALTVSSGGSGGVFAPSLYTGAMLGGGLAAALGEPSAPFVVVGMAAVFGGAARVPIATLIMVTEMTAGYTLLVPAALAVTVSCLVQTWLSSHTPYPSLYEGQVADRIASPAHQVEHVQRALRLLMETKTKLGKIRLGKVDLWRLLAAGAEVELGDGGRLSHLVLTPDDLDDERLAAKSATPLLVVRDGRPLPPGAEHPLKPGDELLLLTWDRGESPAENRPLNPRGDVRESETGASKAARGKETDHVSRVEKHS